MSTSSTITLSWVSENHLCHVLLERAHKISSSKFVYVLCLFSIDKIKVATILKGKKTKCHTLDIISKHRQNIMIIKISMNHLQPQKKTQTFTLNWKFWPTVGGHIMLDIIHTELFFYDKLSMFWLKSWHIWYKFLFFHDKKRRLSSDINRTCQCCSLWIHKFCYIMSYIHLSSFLLCQKFILKLNIFL